MRIAVMWDILTVLYRYVCTGNQECYLPISSGNAIIRRNGTQRYCMQNAATNTPQKGNATKEKARPNTCFKPHTLCFKPAFGSHTTRAMLYGGEKTSWRARLVHRGHGIVVGLQYGIVPKRGLRLLITMSLRQPASRDTALHVHISSLRVGAESRGENGGSWLPACHSQPCIAYGTSVVAMHA